MNNRRFHSFGSVFFLCLLSSLCFPLPSVCIPGLEGLLQLSRHNSELPSPNQRSDGAVQLGPRVSATLCLLVYPSPPGENMPTLSYRWCVLSLNSEVSPILTDLVQVRRTHRRDQRWFRSGIIQKWISWVSTHAKMVQPWVAEGPHRPQGSSSAEQLTSVLFHASWHCYSVFFTLKFKLI